MAERDPLRQQFNLRSGLEAGGKDFDPPLLPYEKSLIETIGCTEEEYKKFVRHAIQKSYLRPAEYENIPDIQNVPAAVVVQLVIGLVFIAASALLAPKVPEQPYQVKIKRKKSFPIKSDQVDSTNRQALITHQALQSLTILLLFRSANEALVPMVASLED